MRKLSTLLFITLFAGLSYGQLSGDIVKDNRKLTVDQGYIINGHVNGKIVFDISVNAEGKVTSAKAVDSESTIRSTPAKIKARNSFPSSTSRLGTWNPKINQGQVVITLSNQNKRHTKRANQ